MEFEVKKIVSSGDVQSEDADNSIQYFNISVGVVGNPHDMTQTSTVKYVFSNALSVQEVKDGIPAFASSWVNANYPPIV